MTPITPVFQPSQLCKPGLHPFIAHQLLLGRRVEVSASESDADLKGALERAAIHNLLHTSSLISDARAIALALVQCIPAGKVGATIVLAQRQLAEYVGGSAEILWNGLAGLIERGVIENDGAWGSCLYVRFITSGVTAVKTLTPVPAVTSEKEVGPRQPDADLLLRHIREQFALARGCGPSLVIDWRAFVDHAGEHIGPGSNDVSSSLRELISVGNINLTGWRAADPPIHWEIAAVNELEAA